MDRAGVVGLVLLAACGGGAESDPGGAPAPALGTLTVRAEDPDEADLPACKVTLRPVGRTRAPRLSHDMHGHVGRWLGDDVVGVDDTVLASRCAMSVPVPAGRYEATVSAGPEREARTQTVELRPDEATSLAVVLDRAVDSVGWSCGDLHVHSAPSIDSDVPLPQRLIAAVAEGLDLIAATDHDALGDWAGAMAETGLSGRLVMIPGNELSPGVTTTETKGHFNVFPVPEDLVLPDAMPHAGLTVEQIVAGARAAAPGAIVQVNHPRSDPWFGYFSLIDFDPVTGAGRAGMLATDFDALEVWNGHGLDLGDDEPPLDDLLEDFFALLRAGRGVIATGNSDTHRLARTPVGFPRTCVRVPHDRPPMLTAEAYVDGLRAGDAFVTSGPFLDVTVQGRGLGALVTPDDDGLVTVAVHVQAPSWVAVDRVQVLVNGEERALLPVGGVPDTVVARVPVGRDAFVVVIARAETPLGVPAGAPRKPMPSLAFSNPVYVDGDGDGLWTPPR